MQGVGKYHKELRIKTESKIAAFLNLQPFGFNELVMISGIGRNGLRSSLDSLVIRNIVRKHIIKKPLVEIGQRVRRGTYYSLNPNNKEAKHLLDAYYKELPPLYTATVKKEVLSSLDKFHRNIESENDDIMKQVTTFKKEVAPYIDKPNNAMNVWVDCIELFRHDRQLITKQLKIFAVKLRLKLDYV
ncbi:MAG: hypothetical protein M3P08_11230 [Thermoproteota archaeon]|nr:hypothetical protein [Thermoproteota archaeon]